MDADVIDEFIQGSKDVKKTTRKIEIDLVARIKVMMVIRSLLNLENVWRI